MYYNDKPYNIPNFIVVGAAKSGTTSLYQYLKQHNDIYMSFRKEIMFFDLNYYKGLEYYAKYFKGYNGEKAIGDISPSYMCDSNVPRRIAKILPKTKIIFLLRNPIDRIYSHYWDLVCWKIIKSDFRDAIHQSAIWKKSYGYLEYDILEMGLYYKYINKYREYYSDDDIGVFLYDDMCEDVYAFMDKIFDFLNISKRVEIDLSDKVNQKRQHKNQILSKILVSERLREYVVSNMNEKTIKKLRKIYDNILSINTEKIKVEEIDDADKSFLLNFYKSDIEKLSCYLNRDLTQWLNI
ncbi:hypothetical protein CR164_11690 [Prosthecochloris marina]|uniref:Sulfotransferase domain-containing protein n=1 Tax=Prosthecochloris marina TaxID=2017681 RepID=A0A317T3L3_9CHLB|nr:sulfotransferase [Prosthecochloris marina]PWW81195.1 hypothetical protein CR164_11690 [Prosthecochloris marina]